MKLLFEEKLYKVFLILTKKRYMAYTCNEDGTMDEKLTIRGVLLARRDNCRWIREIYEMVVRLIMEGASWATIEDRTLDACLQIFRRRVPISKLVITKAVGKNYKIRALPTDPKKCQKRCDDLGIGYEENWDIEKANRTLEKEDENKKMECWLQDYVDRSKPAHIQLAQKMGRRGHPVEVGSRIEYVIVEHHDPKAKQSEKIEDPQYCKKHGDLVKIDSLFYLKSLAKPLDQIFETVFKKKNYLTQLHKLHSQHTKVMNSVYERQAPQFELCDEKGEIVVIKKKSSVKKYTSIYDYYT